MRTHQRPSKSGNRSKASPRNCRSMCRKIWRRRRQQWRRGRLSRRPWLLASQPTRSCWQPTWPTSSWSRCSQQLTRHASTLGMAQDNLGHFSGYMPHPLSSATRSCNASEDKYIPLQGRSKHRSVRTLCRSRGSRLVSWYSMSGRWLCSQSRICCGSNTQHICRAALKCTVS